MLRNIQEHKNISLMSLKNLQEDNFQANQKMNERSFSRTGRSLNHVPKTKINTTATWQVCLQNQMQRL